MIDSEPNILIDMSLILQLPTPLRIFFSYFPLWTYPPIYPPSKATLKTPTIWIHPPRGEADFLSSDVECLKWQAYLALRGLTDITVRWDVSPDGGIDGRLPNLHVPLPTSDGADDGELLAAHLIPTWVDAKVEERGLDSLEGYKDESARDESRAWVALLEGNVHAALVSIA
jgi:metaxin